MKSILLLFLALAGALACIGTGLAGPGAGFKAVTLCHRLEGAPARYVSFRATSARLLEQHRRHRFDKIPMPARGCPRTPPPTKRVYWGAWIGTQYTGTAAPWDMQAAAALERVAGKGMSVIHFGQPWQSCRQQPCTFYRFDLTGMENIRRHGSIPMVSWSSQSVPSSVEQEHFQLADVVAGWYDSYIERWATAARDWGHPFFLRFDWEMNGDWFPWGQGVNGNAPGGYVAAWRHVHDIFTKVGATNATWVWCPNAAPWAGVSEIAGLYPGNAYVDWTCLDGYNWGKNPAKPRGVRSFDQLFAKAYTTIRKLAPSKPLMIGEMSSTEHGLSKAQWIDSALADALAYRYPAVKAVVWLDLNVEGMDWPVTSSKRASRAFADAIRLPAYLPNRFGAISASPIPPP